MKRDDRKRLFRDDGGGHGTGWKGRAAGILFWILVWAVGARLVDFPLVFPGPHLVFLRLADLLTEGAFWLELGRSFLKIFLGALVGIFLGILAGLTSFQSRLLKAALDPLFQILRSVPIAAVIILLLVWIRPQELAMAIVILAVAPLIYASTLAGLDNRDRSLLEMAEVFRLSRRATWQVACLPPLKEQLKPALVHASGNAWKAGISGEIIAQPFGTMGSAMVGAKITLAVDTLFAYVLAIVLAASLLNLMAKKLFSRLDEPRARRQSRQAKQEQLAPGGTLEQGEAWPSPDPAPPAVGIRVRGLCHSYGPLPVLADLQANFPAGQTSVVMGATGIGKTTLFRLLLGLERPEQGEILFTDEGGGQRSRPPRFSCCFQEPRLARELSGLDNLALVRRDNKLCLALMAQAGIRKPHQRVSEYSGGMQQQIAILRALISDSEIIIMDEPFKALDRNSKRRMMALVRQWSQGRTLILSTHSEEERRFFQGHEVFLGSSGQPMA